MRSFSLLLCAALLAGCQPGNDLHRYSGRVLRVSVTDSTGAFLATLVRQEPESGCLQLHHDVTATFDGVALQVYPGAPIVDPDLCNSPDLPPAFTGALDPQLFLGEPRNGVMEIRDGDESIIAEFRNFFGRHTFAQLVPPPTVKPGEEIFLPWDPPTDELSDIENVSLLGTNVPARPETGASVRLRRLFILGGLAQLLGDLSQHGEELGSAHVSEGATRETLGLHVSILSRITG